MWARVVEVMLGLWLLISPFIFGHAAENAGLWINDLFCGSLILTLAFVSFWHPLRYAHLAIGIVALWLIAFGFFVPNPAPPASQNHILLGLVLVMFAIIPNDANLPPLSRRTVPVKLV